MKTGHKLLLAAIMVLFLAACNNRNIDKELRDMADSMNKQAPMINGNLRFDSLSVILPERTIQYNVTIIDKTKEDIDTNALDEEIPETAAKLKESLPKHLKEDNVTIIYSYADMNGKQTHKITITPEMYK